MVDMKSSFTSNLIGNIRIQNVVRLMLCSYNSLTDVQKHVRDTQSMVSASLLLSCLFRKSNELLHISSICSGL